MASPPPHLAPHLRPIPLPPDSRHRRLRLARPNHRRLSRSGNRSSPTESTPRTYFFIEIDAIDVSRDTARVGVRRDDARGEAEGGAEEEREEGEAVARR